MTVGAFAKALVENLGAMRAFLEALVQQEDLDAGRGVRSAPDLMCVRAALERKFIAMAPPVVAGQPGAAAEWLGGLEKFLEDAMDATRAPVEAIPWF
jgi:hypothetical protein